MKIKFLDHIALAVRDLERSAKWYEDTLGLRRVQHPDVWGPFPIMMLADNESGIALFPVRTDSPQDLPHGDFISLRHFAFNVDRESFDQAQRTFEENGVPFYFQDHYFYHSIYIKDPDGYEVELTTSVLP